MAVSSHIKHDYFWNTASSAMIALSSLAMVWVVGKVLEGSLPGLFALCYTTITVQANFVGMFQMRPFHSTDVDQAFSFGTYHASRFVTCTMMLVGVMIFIVATSGFGYKALLVLLLSVLRLIDEVEDVYHGEFQRRGFLALATRSSFFRVLGVTVTFCCVVTLTHNLILTSIVTIMVSLVFFIWLNLPRARQMFSLRPLFHWAEIKTLLMTCFPLFLGAFLYAYIGNGPKFGIDRHFDVDYQYIYFILFLPAFTINLLSGFIFNPLLVSLANEWSTRNVKSFFAIIRKALLAVLGFTALILLITFAVGVPALGFIFSRDISNYGGTLLLLVVAGGFNAGGIIVYYALVTMRKQRTILMTYTAAALLVVLITTPLILCLNLMGAAISYAAGMFIYLVLAGGACEFYGRRQEHR